MNIETLPLQYGEYQVKNIYDTLFLIFKTGKIFRWSKCGYWKYIHNTAISHGYNLIGIGKKGNKTMIKRHRLMAYTLLNLDIDNPKMEVDHIDGNRINNHINNLRVVNRQQNQWNRTKAKGYTYVKHLNKYKAQITHDTKVSGLGYYDTEEEAHQAYLNAKIIYHII